MGVGILMQYVLSHEMMQWPHFFGDTSLLHHFDLLYQALPVIEYPHR